MAEILLSLQRVRSISWILDIRRLWVDSWRNADAKSLIFHSDLQMACWNKYS